MMRRLVRGLVALTLGTSLLCGLSAPAQAVNSGSGLRRLLVIPVNWVAGNGSPAAPQGQTAYQILGLANRNQAYYTDQLPNVGLGSFLMDLTPASPNGFRDAAMLAGTSWVNPLGSLRITVNSTTPAAAQITVAPNTVAVPDIVGLTRGGAAGALNAVGLALGYETSRQVTACELIGQVLSQNPAAGSSALIGSWVNFTFAVKPTGTLHRN